ncbi:MAG TPA: adenylate/guanylate cyclase domain-containing protein, partial [Candidatus Ozemobacteraceae bacterium]|nr:adenylate/guanylate cyclase domain-containing protein [Candidatus Ozemobacteraceae bacterium]
MSTTPARMTDRLMFAELSSGTIRAASEADLKRKRGILFSVLLFSILLSRYVATRFLKPLTSLTMAARRMMSQDFTVRLPIEHGGEFGDVAVSFNLMAQGVEEGRLLSKFVSESVRSAAKDSSREEAARRGEQSEATILFAGLGNFKSVLSGTDPALLIPRLNRYLETMSQAIRDNGGDIDKFIGEKILAVFFPERSGGRGRSAGSALSAAIEMQKRMDDLRVDLDLPLGIGIVSGPVLAGILGTPDVRLEYTVIGDTVNLASRLGDMAIRLDRNGEILGSTDGAAGGILVEAGLGHLLSGESAELQTLLRALHLPAIKGKTRSVHACRVSH